VQSKICEAGKQGDVKARMQLGLEVHFPSMKKHGPALHRLCMEAWKRLLWHCMGITVLLCVSQGGGFSYPKGDEAEWH